MNVRKIFGLAALVLFISPVSAHAALTDNLQAYWKFDESSGDASDSVGGNTLTNVASVTYSAGVINNAAYVDGTNYFTASSTTTPGSDFSVSAWVYKNDTTTGSVMGKDVTVGYIFDFSNCSTDYCLYVGSGSGVEQVNWDIGLRSNYIGVWTHFVVTYSSTTATLYVNGVSQGTRTISQISPITEIGRGQSENTFPGRLDEIGMWSRALSPTEVTQLYRCGAGFQYPFSGDSSCPLPPLAAITGSGTINRLAKFTTSTTTIGDSLFSDDGSNMTLTAGNLLMQIGSLLDTVASGALNFGTTNATTLTFGRSGQYAIFNSNVGIGTTTPVGPLSIQGVADFTTATSTFHGNGLNLEHGCFAVNGVCIGSGTGASSGVNSIAQTYGTGQTGALVFATSSLSFNGLTSGVKIVNSGTTFTFSPLLSGTLGVAGGGTGTSTFTANRLLSSNSAGTGLTFVATSSLNIGGTAANVTGTVAVANGGTGTTSLSGILVGNGLSFIKSLIVGSGLSFDGSTLSVATSSNCNSSASPATCGSATSGSVALATGGSTLVVNTTAVTANSQILITEDSSLGTRLGITCNTTTGRTYTISARTAGTSFTIKSSANPASNKACLSYWIIN